MVNADAPGPLMVRSSTVAVIAPLASVIVLHESPVRSMMSPLTAVVTAPRSVPTPLSSQLVTAVIPGGRSGGGGFATRARATASSITCFSDRPLRVRPDDDANQ